MSGATRFDCYPSDFLNGIVGLPADDIATYTVIVMMQYDRGGPVVYRGREREIAVRCGMSRGRVGQAIDRLTAIGKLILDSKGCLFNGRAAEELAKISERISKNAENSKKGGKSTREKYDRIRNENKEAVEPIGQPNGQPKHSPIPSPSPPPSASKSSVSKDGNGRPEPPPDPDADLFRYGKEILGKSAGGQIRKLKDLFLGDLIRAREFLADAAKKQDPSEYVAAAIRRHTGANGSSPFDNVRWAQTA